MYEVWGVRPITLLETLLLSWIIGCRSYIQDNVTVLPTKQVKYPRSARMALHPVAILALEQELKYSY